VHCGPAEPFQPPQALVQVVTSSHDKYEASYAKIQDSHRKSKGVAEKRRLEAVPGSGGVVGDGQRLPKAYNSLADQPG